MIKMKHNSKGITYALLAVLLWSTLGIGFKLAVNNLDSFTVTLLVGFCATLSLFIYLVIKNKIKSSFSMLKKNPIYFIVAGIIGLGIHPILYLKGYSLLSASNTVVLFYTYPLIMILLSSVLFKDKLSLGSILSILIGFLGVFMIITRGNLLGFAINLGTILTLIAALCWAGFSVIIKYKKFDVIRGMFLFNLFGFIFLCLMIPFFGINLNITLKPILGLIYLGVFPTAIAFILWNKSLHLINTDTCSNLALLTPVFSILLIQIILKEALVLTNIIGLVIVLGSVFLNFKLSKQKINIGGK